MFLMCQTRLNNSHLYFIQPVPCFLPHLCMKGMNMHDACFVWFSLNKQRHQEEALLFAMSWDLCLKEANDNYWMLCILYELCIIWAQRDECNNNNTQVELYFIDFYWFGCYYNKIYLKKTKWFGHFLFTSVYDGTGWDDSREGHRWARAVNQGDIKRTSSTTVAFWPRHKAENCSGVEM